MAEINSQQKPFESPSAENAARMWHCTNAQDYRTSLSQEFPEADYPIVIAAGCPGGSNRSAAVLTWVEKKTSEQDHIAVVRPNKTEGQFTETGHRGEGLPLIGIFGAIAHGAYTYDSKQNTIHIHGTVGPDRHPLMVTRLILINDSDPTTSILIQRILNVLAKRQICIEVDIVDDYQGSVEQAFSLHTQTPLKPRSSRVKNGGNGTNGDRYIKATEIDGLNAEIVAATQVTHTEKDDADHAMTYEDAFAEAFPAPEPEDGLDDAEQPDQMTAQTAFERAFIDDQRRWAEEHPRPEALDVTHADPGDTDSKSAGPAADQFDDAITDAAVPNPEDRVVAEKKFVLKKLLNWFSKDE